MLNYQRVLSISPVLSNTIHVILDLDDSYFHVHRPITPCPSPRLAWGSHGTDLPSYPPSECLPKEPTYGDDFSSATDWGIPIDPFFWTRVNLGTMNHVYWCLLCKDHQIMVILSKFGYQTVTTLPTPPALQDLWQTMCLHFFFFPKPTTGRVVRFLFLKYITLYYPNFCDFNSNLAVSILD